MQQTGAVNFSEGLKARASGLFPAENDAGFERGTNPLPDGHNELRTSSPANVGQDKDSDKRQHQAIEAFAKSAGFEILGEFDDQAVTGADPLDERPGFAAMLERIAGKGARTIIVETANHTALVKASGIDRSTITDVVRRLDDAGLLQRRRLKNDARSYAVKLTAAGLAILKAAEARVRDADRQLLSRLPRLDRKGFLEMLKAIGREAS